jgi:cation transport regulator ChaB
MRRISLARPFNNAWRIYAAREPYRREEIEHRVAWAAVKKSCRKVGDDAVRSLAR